MRRPRVVQINIKTLILSVNVQPLASTANEMLHIGLLLDLVPSSRSSLV